MHANSVQETGRSTPRRERPKGPVSAPWVGGRRCRSFFGDICIARYTRAFYTGVSVLLKI